jgi:hypothetical protein
MNLKREFMKMTVTTEFKEVLRWKIFMIITA